MDIGNGPYSGWAIAISALVLSAARKLKGPEVEMIDLFDLDPDSAENQ